MIYLLVSPLWLSLQSFLDEFQIHHLGNIQVLKLIVAKGIIVERKIGTLIERYEELEKVSLNAHFCNM